MSGVAIGMGVGSAAVGIGGAMLGSSAQKKAAQQALKAQTAAAGQATQSLQGGYEEALMRGTQYEGLGQEGAYRLASALGGKEYTYSDANYEILPQTEAMKYRTPELMAAGSESLLKQLEQLVTSGKGGTPFFNNKYKGDIPVSRIYADAMAAVKAGKTPEQAFKSLTYGDHNVGNAVKQGLDNYQKDPSAGFVIPGYRASINVTQDTKQIFDPNDTTKNVYRDRTTGAITTAPKTTTVNEKGFDEAKYDKFKPYDFQNPEYKDTQLNRYQAQDFNVPNYQDVELSGFKTSEFKDGAVPMYKGMTQEDFDREVTNRDIQTDPAFQWKQDKMNRELNAQLASRGKYFNPRVTEAALGEANMRLVSDEYDKGYARNLNRFGQLEALGRTQYGADVQGYGLTRQQEIDKYGRELTANERQRQHELDRINQANQNYARQYGAETDQYNRGITNYQNTRQSDIDQITYNDASYNRQLAQEKDAYQRYLDAYKTQLGEYGLETDANTRRYQRLLDLTKIGQGQAQQAGNWATNTGSNIANIQTGLGNAQANAANARGAAEAQQWGNIAGSVTGALNTGMNAYKTFGTPTAIPQSSMIDNPARNVQGQDPLQWTYDA